MININTNILGITTYLTLGDPVVLDAGISFSGGNDYRGGYLDVAINSPTPSETLSLDVDLSPSIIDGELSIVGTDVFIGNGTAALLAGSVDATLNGQNGQNLRINFATDATLPVAIDDILLSAIAQKVEYVNTLVDPNTLKTLIVEAKNTVGDIASEIINVDVVLGAAPNPSFTSITRQNPVAAVTGADSLVFRATFDQAVKNVDASDFVVVGSTATVTGVGVVSDSVYDITISGGDLADYNGTVGLDLSGIQDIADFADNLLPTAEPGIDDIYTLTNSSDPNGSDPNGGALTPTGGGKVIEVSSLGTANTISLQLQEVGINSVSELLTFTTDSLGNNRTQIGSFFLLKGGQLPADYSPEFTLDSSQIAEGQFLQFDLVQNGVARTATATSGSNGQVGLDFGDGTRLLALPSIQTSTTNLLFDDAATIDLTGVTDPLSMEFMVYREAKFNNTVGLYRTDNANGGIADPLTGNILNPGDEGYKAAALARQLDVRLTGQNGQVSSFSTNVAGGGFLGMFLVVNGTDPLASEVYFSHMGANTDKLDHAKSLGDNTFGFEDLAGLGDRDFNDVVVKFAVV